MAIHVNDEDTDWLVREFARRRGLGITAAINAAVLEALVKDMSEGEVLGPRLEPLLKQIRAHLRERSEEDDKPFVDDMWDDDLDSMAR